MPPEIDTNNLTRKVDLIGSIEELVKAGRAPIIQEVHLLGEPLDRLHLYCCMPPENHYPPGYSYSHAYSDFDSGRSVWGYTRENSEPIIRYGSLFEITAEEAQIIQKRVEDELDLQLVYACPA